MESLSYKQPASVRVFQGGECTWTVAACALTRVFERKAALHPAAQALQCHAAFSEHDAHNIAQLRLKKIIFASGQEKWPASNAMVRSLSFSSSSTPLHHSKSGVSAPFLPCFVLSARSGQILSFLCLKSESESEPEKKRLLRWSGHVHFWKHEEARQRGEILTWFRADKHVCRS